MDEKVFHLVLGNSAQVLSELADNSIDSVVTDPPYAWSFMGNSWDNFEGRDFADWTCQWAKQALRVLKPGGHLLAFGGSRTYHRLACGIEDAGFEVRDQISYYCSGDEQKETFFNNLSLDQREQFLNAFGRPSTIDWVYGSGFPKSLDVAKKIDADAGAKREVVGTKVGMPGYSLKENDTPEHNRSAYGQYTDAKSECDITRPATDAAKKWDGWGTALKPAHEPIVVARKPLIGTVVENVLKYGTGAINIDGCRVEGPMDGWWGYKHGTAPGNHGTMNGGWTPEYRTQKHDSGRFPANVIHDGSYEVLAAFPDAPGALAPVKGTEPSSVTKNTYGARQRVPFNTREGEASANRRYTEEGGTNFAALPGPRGGDPAGRFPANVIHDGSDEVLDESAKAGDRPTGRLNRANIKAENAIYGKAPKQRIGTYEPSNGSAARFFYCSKASKKERGPGNDWPTVKPIALMRYLVRLVTPPGGLVLDPFVGSGSTGIAALREGFRFIGIDADQHALDIAQARYDAEVKHDS